MAIEVVWVTWIDGYDIGVPEGVFRTREAAEESFDPVSRRTANSIELVWNRTEDQSWSQHGHVAQRYEVQG